MLLAVLAFAPAVADAASGPRLRQALTQDRDRDGRVDAVRLSFSEAIRGKPKPSAFKVKGMRIVGVAKARRKRIVVKVREGNRCDLGGNPVARFRGKGLKDRRSRRVRPSRVNMERKDSSPPRLTCAETRDADHDGRVDALMLTYSKRVRHSRQAGGKFPFSVEGYKLRSAESARGRYLELQLKERSKPDTDARPAVTYTTAPRKLAVTGRGGQAFPGTYKAVKDRLPPLLLGARTADVDADGLLDRMSLAYSEPVSKPAADAYSVAGVPVTKAAVVMSNVTLLVAEGRYGTGARPGLTYRGGSLKDVAGNRVLAAALTPADGAAPLLVAAHTADVDGASGRLDTLRVTFSEPVLHPLDADGQYPFGVTGYGITKAGAAAGASLNLSLQEGGSPDTGARPPVGYARGKGAAVRDAAGNEALTRALAGTSDGVAPKLLAATTLDVDGDGTLDRARFSFSEPVTHPAEAGPGGFSVTGQALGAALAASGSGVDLTLVEAGAPNSGLRPAGGYSPTGVNDVKDAAGNRAGAGSVPQLADGAPPVVVSAATADAGPTNQRIDRVQLGFSEPLVAAADGAAPFSFSASGYTVASVGAAAGSNLDVVLQEATDPDTGSAPTISYTGGGTPVRDANSLESPSRSYGGLTRDAVAPSLLSVDTDDADANGTLDRIEAVYSEQMTGSAATAPFSVSGRTLTGVTYSGARVRIAFTELGGFDTDQRPSASYTPGDVRDVPEGPGDTSHNAPAFNLAQPADGAGPALVGAATRDNDSDGIIDGVRVTFSEQISHPADGSSPFTLAVAGRVETAVSSPVGAGDELDVTVTEASSPDGGYRPDVSVTSVPVPNERIRDLAAVPNDAAVSSFPSATDGVQPVLLSAQMGESEAGGCERTAAPGINGRIDCVRASWSEPVSQTADASPPYSLGIDNGYAVAPGGVPASSNSSTLDVPLQEKLDPDRDKLANLSYTAGITETVTDAGGNEALSSSVAAARACPDLPANEDNESLATATPLADTSPSPERKCAFDDDWFKVTSGGAVKFLVRPSSSLAPAVEVADSGGMVIHSAGPGAEGQSVEGNVAGVSAGQDYYVRVFRPGGPEEASPQEGTYCVSIAVTATSDANCGPNVGELIFTEVGLDGSASQKFVEIKNVSDFPFDLDQTGLELRRAGSSCSISPPPVDRVVDPGEYAVITSDGAGDTFSCSEVANLAMGGDALELRAGATPIDDVDFTGILTSGVASGHSLEIKPSAESGSADPDEVAENWCRTWQADNKGAAGDGCDEYRVNEVLFDPVSSGVDGLQGGAFAEIGGNLPAKAGSKLLGGWVLRGVNGDTGGGTSDFTLPASASPRANGTYVVADGVDGSNPLRTNVAAGQFDLIWEGLDLADHSWPDLGAPDPGPRGLQLLRPDPVANPPCNNSLADVLGWRQTSEAFTQLSDQLRDCASLEGDPVAPVPTPGRSAARDNLSSAGDTTYNSNSDTGNNATDFCRQTPPNPGALNVRPSC